MAQVTMTSQEYLELVFKARKLDQLEQAMLENVEVTVDPERTYSKYEIRIEPTLTEDVQKQVIRKVVDELVAHDFVMDDLCGDNKRFMSVSDGYIRHNWDNKPEVGEIDLMTDKAFKKAWDEARARLDAVAAAVTEAEEEA